MYFTIIVYLTGNVHYGQGNPACLQCIGQTFTSIFGHLHSGPLWIFFLFLILRCFSSYDDMSLKRRVSCPLVRSKSFQLPTSEGKSHLWRWGEFWCQSTLYFLSTPPLLSCNAHCFTQLWFCLFQPDSISPCSFLTAWEAKMMPITSRLPT